MKLNRLFLALAITLAACTPNALPENTQSGTENTGDNTGDDTGSGTGTGEEGGSSAAAGTYTIDFTSKGYGNETVVTSVTQDGITVAFSNGKWFDSGEAVRAYGGSTITVSASKKMTKIVFTFGTRNDGDNKITANVGSFTSPNWSSSGAGKVIFSVDGTSGNRRIQKMEVTLSNEDAPAEEGGGSQDQPGVGDEQPSQPGVDVLDNAFTGVTSSQYAEWTGNGSGSSAVYKGSSAGSNNCIQLRSKNSDSGIVSTTSGGKLAKVEVVWNSNTDTNGHGDRYLQVYGSTTAYTSYTQLFGTAPVGTLLGELKYPNDNSLTVSDNYAYVGLRSKDGAVYFDKITITWN